MLSLEKLRVACAGVSLTYPLQFPHRAPNRAAQQPQLSPENMKATIPQDSFPDAPTFDGVSDQMDMPYAPELNPASFTVEMWILVQGGKEYQSIIASVGGSPLQGRKGYLFCVTPARQLQFWLGHGEPRSLWQVLSGPSICLHVWTHIAGTYDQRSQTMAFYVNGQEVGCQTGVPYQPNDEHPTRIGAGATHQRGASPCFFHGKIAEVHIWDRVLKLHEIQALSAQREIAMQVESTEHNTHEPDTEVLHRGQSETGPAPPVEPAGIQMSCGSSSTAPIIEPPLIDQPPHPQLSLSQPPSVLWQIGRPWQVGMMVPIGAWRPVYNYVIGADPDPLNCPTIPAFLVPIEGNKLQNSTSQLNILFVLAENYAEGQLVFCYERYGFGEDYIYLDGRLIASTPSANNRQRKQSQVPLVSLLQGLHALSITVSNRANSTHVLDYLQLQTLNL